MQWFGIFSDKKGRRLWDWHLVLFFLNVFLVVYGYGTRGGEFQIVKIVRTVLVIGSVVGLLFLHGNIKYVFNETKSWILWVFIGLNFVIAPFSTNFFKSIERLLSWIPFMIYINYFIVYLFTQYTKDEAKIKLLQIFNLAYIYPVSLMFVYGVVFQTENVYGDNVGLFKANVVGWACTIFVITGFDLYANVGMPKWLRNAFFLVAFLTLWGIVLTGSRSSYMSLAAAGAVLVVRNKILPIQIKFLALLLLAGFAYYIINSPDSVVNLRAQYASLRNQRGEVRVQLAQKAFDAISKNPELMFTGFGFDNFREGLLQYGGVKTELASHNSYLEVFFSGGIFCFLFFVIFVVFTSIKKYIQFDSQQFVFFPMLVIVPYFESNLNAGQFLFFPWMTFMFYYIHVSSLQAPLETMNVSRKKILGWQK